MLLLFLKTESAVDIDCVNGDGLTSLLLSTRDSLLFEKLGNFVGKNFRPVETVRVLLACGA